MNHPLGMYGCGDTTTTAAAVSVGTVALYAVGGLALYLGYRMLVGMDRQSRYATIRQNRRDEAYGRRMSAIAHERYGR